MIKRLVFSMFLAVSLSAAFAKPRFELEARQILFINDELLPPVSVDVGYVDTIKSGTPFYHWGDEWQKKWADDGFPDSEGVKEARRLQVGCYVSSNIMDSSEYGPILVLNTALKDLNEKI